jgi:hypothetical protein
MSGRSIKDLLTGKKKEKFLCFQSYVVQTYDGVDV